MKKLLSTTLALALSLTLVACTSSEESSTGNDTQGQASGLITVVSREDGSGTRGAFTELTGVDDGDNDNTTLDASIQNSTGAVMTLVANDPNAIGYISLGSLNDTVKAIGVDGVNPSVETIADGSYKVARPFNIATNKSTDLDEVSSELLDFIFSDEGQEIVASNGLIAVESTGAFQSEMPSGNITVGGSTSVTPVMEKLVESYLAINTNATIDIQGVGSSAGMTGAIDGTFDIGMASRDMKDSELESLNDYVIALDGIAVVVNNSNTIENVTMDDLMNIYTGEIIDFSELG